MRAAVTTKEAKLELRTVPTPAPSPGQVLVRVRACGLNRADLLQRLGMYPPPPDAPPDIPGLEIAGEVEALGSGTTEFRVGDRVFGIVSGGAYAESIAVHARTLAPIPSVNGKPLDFTSAAAIPEAFITAYDAMVLQCGLTAGETVLVHAVGSGVGTAAVQIARAIGARAIGTARSEAKLERAMQLGMSAGIVVASQGDDGPRFAARARELTGGRGVETVLELVGGSYVPESLAALADRGRLILVGRMGGAQANIDLGSILFRRLRIMGTVLRTRPLEEKIAAGHVLARQLSPLIAEGKLVPIVDRVMPLEQANAALDYMGANASFGKIVLTMD